MVHNLNNALEERDLARQERDNLDAERAELEHAVERLEIERSRLLTVIDKQDREIRGLRGALNRVLGTTHVAIPVDLLITTARLLGRIGQERPLPLAVSRLIALANSIEDRHATD